MVLIQGRDTVAGSVGAAVTAAAALAGRVADRAFSTFSSKSTSEVLDALVEICSEGW